MSQIYFCRDGVLRRAFTRYDKDSQTRHDHLVPLMAYEKVVDEHVFLKSLHSSIVFEDGLTVAQMMENLAPWAEKMIGAGVLDFPAFLEEVRRAPSEKVDDVKEIVLDYRVCLKSLADFEEASANELIGVPRASGKLTVQEGWDMHAILTEAGREAYHGSTEVAIDYTPMSEWKHLEIKIDRQGRFIDYTAHSSDQMYLGVKQSITDRSHPMVKASLGRNDDVIDHSFPIVAPFPDFFNCLIHGFFWEVGFSYSPAQRNDLIDLVSSRAEDIKDQLDPDHSVEGALENLKTVRDENKEYHQKTRWLEQMTTTCQAQGLPLPKKA